MVKVLVKWGKERFELDTSTEDSPLQFKSQIFSLTGVKPDRQKVLIKGRVLGDTWDGVELKDGTMMMMVGTGAQLPTALVQHDEQPPPKINVESAPLKLPVGLTNLGNTCYLNATMQYLKSISELQETLNKYGSSFNYPEHVFRNQSVAKALTLAASDLYQQMDKRGSSFAPNLMVRTVQYKLPQFAVRDGSGWMQQDANEFWNEMIRAFQTELTSAVVDQSGPFVSKYLEGVFKVEMKNLESDEEPVKVFTEKFLQLSCFLSQEVRYVHMGIKNKMTEQITKNSEILGRDAKYERKALIDRLPGYLSIQLVRFFYKEKEKINAKILKDVKFPLMLDVYDMCTPELQQKLSKVRDAFKEEEDRRHEALRTSKTDDADPVKESNATNDENEETVPYSFSDDPGSNNSGFYDLKAIITHKGRSSTSGHYVAWVHLKDKHWAMCDDDKIQQVTSEEILALSGGGDWHCAYLLLYGPRVLKKSANS